MPKSESPDPQLKPTAERAGEDPQAAPELIAFRITDRHPMRLAAAPRWRAWMNETTARFANRCLPLLVANQGGWVLLNPLTFQATWTGGEGPKSLTIEFAKRRPAVPPAVSRFGHGVISWQVPYLFRTPPGYNLLVRGPANWPKDGVCPLEGLVETDWAVATFTMNWKLTRPGHPVTFEADEPFCMLVPQRRGELEAFRPQIKGVDADPTSRDGFKQFAVARHLQTASKRLLESKGHSEAANKLWEGHYFRGRRPDGTTEAMHQTKLNLPDFTEEA